MKPFLKWAGGKTKLVIEIFERLPFKWTGDYIEPFIGGGAVYFALRRAHNANALGHFRAFLGDINGELINAYQVLQATPKPLIKMLGEIRHSAKFYYSMRDSNPRTTLTRATRFIYLNRTCFNGLYRVNRAGEFNVPVGKKNDGKPKHFLVDEDSLLKAHRALAIPGTAIHVQNFHNTIDCATRGDFIYCDPPYLPKTDTADFTAYDKSGFALGDHEQLHTELKKADKRGAKFMLSEGDSKFIRKLFADFNVVPVKSRHSISASADSRTTSKELLIMNYDKFTPWHVVG